MERNGQVKGEGREWCFGWKAQQEQSHGADKEVAGNLVLLGAGEGESIRLEGWADARLGRS